MKQIYMCGVGGSITGANVEVHDMQFVYKEQLEDCFEELRHRWYGNTLHLDSYTILKYIDGYTIDLQKDSTHNLYMIVYGGYNPSIVDEVHHYHFLLADNQIAAKEQAKRDMKDFPHMNHIDEIVDVFENIGFRFGFIPSNQSFADNTRTHKYIKLT